MPTIELTAEDIDQLHTALAVYREDRVRMARLMEDARYMNDLPWVRDFSARLSALAPAMRETPHA